MGGGRACIIAPSGKVLTDEIPPNKEGIAYAEINLEEIIRFKVFF